MSNKGISGMWVNTLSRLSSISSSSFFSFETFFRKAYTKSHQIIIRSGYVGDFFPAFFTLMKNHDSFMLFHNYINSPHDSTAFCCAVSWEICIYMQGTKTIWAMVSCWSSRVFCDSLLAVYTNKRFIEHNKIHGAMLYDMRKFANLAGSFVTWQAHLYW